MKISGTTKLIAHLGYPTESFKAPLIYNPYFNEFEINAVVVPMGCKSDDFAGFFRGVTRLSNFHGGLITMPHKNAVVEFLDELSTTVQITGSCNAVKRNADGSLIGDMFDGDGFVRGVERNGRDLKGGNALVIGCGGAGSAIAASMAQAGVARLGLLEANAQKSNVLADRLAKHCPGVSVELQPTNNQSWDVIVNATPLGMKKDDPLPMDLSNTPGSTLIGEVVLTTEMTPFLHAARAQGCDIQIGLDMLYEQMPAYLEFFGYRTTTPAELRAIAKL